MRSAHCQTLSDRIRREVHRYHPRRELARALTWGVGLIAIGGWWLWQGNQAWASDEAPWRTLVPALLVWSGTVLALVVRNAWAVVTGLHRVAFGAWLYVVFHGLWGWTLWQTWPVTLVFVGVAIVARGLLDPADAWDDGPGATPPLTRKESPQ